MYLSDFLRGGQTLQGEAGPYAIAANDLLEVNQFGQLSTVTVSDYAAVSAANTAAVAVTTAYAYGQLSLAAQVTFINPADGSIFIPAAINSTTQGLQVFKYSPAGTLLGQGTLDSSAVGLTSVSVVQLSNGNLAWIYSLSGTVYFLVTDTNLQIIVAKTSIAASTATNSVSVVALSGGGFALCVFTTVWRYAIYTNAGGVTSAVADITGAPSTMIQSEAALLSNGNVAFAIMGGTFPTFGFAVYTAAGAAAVAWTTCLSGGVAESVGISALSGYFCIGCENESVTNFLVYNNAGAQQSSTLAGTGQVGLTNDGTYFWGSSTNGSAGGEVVRIPTTGSSVVQSTITAAVALYNLVYDHGFLIGRNAGATYVFQTQTNGAALLCSTFAQSILPGLAAWQPCGDFCLFMYEPPAQFAVLKYLNTAIEGVSSSAVAAGNAGTIIPFSHGGGSGKNGYPCNPILGTVGKGFDHSASGIVGNKGTMLGNSVALEGII